MCMLLLLGRVALVAQRPTVIKLSRERSVGRSVCLSSALWKNGGLDPDAVWRRRSDGSSDEAAGGVWQSVHGEGYFWGRIWGAPLSKGAYRAYVCYCAATRPSSQITLGRLVNCWCSRQAGRYQEALELAERAKDIEEKELGGRRDKMADIYQMCANAMDEVFSRTFLLFMPWLPVKWN